MGLFDFKLPEIRVPGIRIETPQILKDLRDLPGKAESGIRRDLASLESGVKRDITSLGTNIERNYQKFAQVGANILSGDFNNIGQSLLTMGVSLTGVTNPDDVRRLAGESGVDRKVREAVEKGELDLATTNAAIEAKRLSGLATTFEQMAVGRAGLPGRRGTMLTGATPGTSGTLLTSKGGSY